MDDFCSFCGTVYKPNAAFCASCGHRRIALDQPGEIRFVFKFFVVLLAVMVPGVIYVAHLEGDPFETDIMLTSGIAIVTLGFALTRRELWWPLYKSFGFGPLGYALVLLAAPVVLGLVLGYVQGLHNLFGIQPIDEMQPFRAHHMMWAIGLIVIAPPIIEELAFRGLIYTGLRKTLGVSESFIISSFAFALLHMALPAIITHLPLGLYLCWLRHRSNSLWPAMFAHALHNGGVILVDYLGWA